MSAPVLLGPENCASVIGIGWRRARDLARRLGVRRVQAGRAMLIPVQDLLAALERVGSEPEPATPQDARAQVLAALGRGGDS